MYSTTLSYQIYTVFGNLYSTVTPFLPISNDVGNPTIKEAPLFWLGDKTADLRSGNVKARFIAEISWSGDIYKGYNP